MSKLLKSMAVGIVALGALLVSPAVSAEAVCEVGYTGPDSENRCITTTRYACSVSTDNEVVITDTNNQNAVSGTATLEDNGDGGTATSGSVTNANGTTFDFVIDNGDYYSEEPGVCVVTASVPATETPETPEVPVTPVQPTAPGGGAVTALPVTSGSEGSLLLTVASIVGGVALLGAVAATLYGRYARR